MEDKKEVIEQSIIERYTKKNDKGEPVTFNMAGAVLELDARCKSDAMRLDRIEEALAFFSNWYVKMENIENKKIILPGDTSFNDLQTKLKL